MVQMKFTIITVNYNNKAGLQKTIKSVINQCFNRAEFVIIDGASTDGSMEVIKEYESQIDYWISEPDKGIYNAMNKGLLQAHGEYLIFMNSGDEFYDSDVLQDIVSLLDTDIVVGRVMHGTDIWGFGKSTISMLDLVQGTVMHQASFIRRELFDTYMYDEKYKIVSDWKFYIQSLILGNATFRNIDRVICKFAPGGISETDMDRKIKERDKVYKELFPDRIMADYFRFSIADSPLLELTPRLNKTYRLNELAYTIINGFIRINDFFSSVKQFVK